MSGMNSGDICCNYLPKHRVNTFLLTGLKIRIIPEEAITNKIACGAWHINPKELGLGLTHFHRTRKIPQASFEIVTLNFL